jgi:uncharacterized surface protein with fasciclin (FAS1) repeats
MKNIISKSIVAIAAISVLPFAQVAAHNCAGADKNIVETAQAAGSFETLVTAVQAAELDSTLAGEGPFTVFAPSDEAFGKLPEGTVEELLKPENREKLAGILTYHVIPGKIMAADVKSGKVKTVNGKEIAIAVQDGAVMVGGAKVVSTDIKTSNGVIHVIDSVVLP